MKGNYWKLKGQADTITKMEEVLGEDNVDMLYSHFFYVTNLSPISGY